MRKNKYLFVICMLLAITLASAIFTRVYVNLEDSGDNGKLRVVTSFYPVYIAALNVAGDSESIILENLSEPQTGCMHDYQLTPQDMILLSKADLFLVNGSGIENFLSEVGESYPGLTIAEATEGLELLTEKEGEAFHEDEAEENAHAWMDTSLYAQMVENIADDFAAADKEHADVYRENAKEYCKKIDGLTEQAEELKTSNKNIIIFHEAFEYVARQYGLNVTYCLDLDEERQISAGEIADVMDEIDKNHVSLIFAEELYGSDMGGMVESETDCGVYYLDSLVRGKYEADSYLEGMQKNIDIVKASLEEIN